MPRSVADVGVPGEAESADVRSVDLRQRAEALLVVRPPKHSRMIDPGGAAGGRHRAGRKKGRRGEERRNEPAQAAHAAAAPGISLASAQ
jgi:hypothetical protein